MSALAALVILALVAPGGAQEDDEAAPDGKALYVRNCESCHGADGDGRGVLVEQMGKRARSFADGGFSFGNTREALFRTITSGIPGRSLMPGFQGVMTEEERWAVVDYVRTLMPPSTDDLRGSELRVGRRPVVARGLLPPIVEGAPRRPRGLLVGLPDGLSFEYRVDDVRLLGVRQGLFADREDWGGRGGGYLRPLGVPVFPLEGGQPGGTFSSGGTELNARFLGSWVRDQRAGITYALETLGEGGGRGERLGTVRESCAVAGLSTGAAFTRRFDIRFEGEVPLGLRVSGRAPGGWVADAVQPRAQTTWLVADRGEDGFDALFLRFPRGAEVIQQPDAAARVELVGPPGSSTQVRITHVITSEWSPELLESLEKEIGR